MNSSAATPSQDLVSRSGLRYRKVRDRIIETFLLAAGLVAVFTTLAIVAILLIESAAFFEHVSLKEFLTDTMWTPLFADAAVASFPNAQVVDEEGLLGRAFSASYGPKDAVRKERLAARLMALFAECQHSGRAALQYRTVVYHARKS